MLDTRDDAPPRSAPELAPPQPGPPEPDSPEPDSPEPGPPTPTPSADILLSEAVVEELDALLATRAHTDDTPVDEAARRARAVEWAIRAERRHRFAAEHGDAEAKPLPPAPPHPADSGD